MARLSLEHKVPLLIGAVLLVLIVTLSFAAYREMRRAAYRVTTERLSSVTLQLRDMLQQSGTQLRTIAAAQARKTNPAAGVSGLRYEGPQAEQVIAVQLRDSADRVVLSTASPSVGVDTIPARDVIASARRDSASIGSFRSLRDTIVYPIVTPLGDGRHYLIQWRRLAGSRRAREQTTRLVGLEATIFLGSQNSALWTDLERPVRAPPVRSAANETQTYLRDDGSEHLLSSAAIPGTPWTIAVDFPTANMIAPVNSLMRRLAVIAGMLLAVAIVVGWLLSRPLARKVEERTHELKVALDQLRDAQEVLVRKEKLAILGQLSSGVGHELRNPLGVMTNAIYYLKAVLSTAPDSVKEYLDIVQQQITLSEKIVSDLLDFARQKPPQRKPTSIAEVTQAQIARLGSTNGVKFESALPADLPPVLVDPVQLGQIVLNLFTNAVQAVGKTGTVQIRAERNNGVVWYDVRDSGPGIKEENLDKVFEPLFTTKARGIGLGLAVSRTLARANSGDLTLTSKPGEGASFRVTLQAVEARA